MPAVIEQHGVCVVAKTVGGDYQGVVFWKIGVLWTGPKASKFRGIEIIGKEVIRYSPDQIARVKDLSSSQNLNGAEAGAAALGGLFLAGPAGLALGLVSGRRNESVFGVELTDGKKIIIQQENIHDKTFQCFRKYVEEKHLLELSF